MIVIYFLDIHANKRDLYYYIIFHMNSFLKQIFFFDFFESGHLF